MKDCSVVNMLVVDMKGDDGEEREELAPESGRHYRRMHEVNVG